MLFRVGDARDIRVDQDFYRFYPNFGQAWACGTVIEITAEHITVDFCDSKVIYHREQVSLVFAPHLGGDIYMTVQDGEVLKVYQPDMPIQPSEIDYNDVSDVADLLDQSKWGPVPSYEASCSRHPSRAYRGKAFHKGLHNQSDK